MIQNRRSAIDMIMLLLGSNYLRMFNDLTANSNPCYINMYYQSMYVLCTKRQYTGTELNAVNCIFWYVLMAVSVSHHRRYGFLARRRYVLLHDCSYLQKGKLVVLYHICYEFISSLSVRQLLLRVHSRQNCVVLLNLCKY